METLRTTFAGDERIEGALNEIADKTLEGNQAR